MMYKPNSFTTTGIEEQRRTELGRRRGGKGKARAENGLFISQEEKEDKVDTLPRAVVSYIYLFTRSVSNIV